MSLVLKILIVVAVIVLLFRGPALLKQLTKLAQTAGRDRSGPPAGRDAGGAKEPGRPVELQACPVCGIFSNERCDRPDCPRPHRR